MPFNYDYSEPARLFSSARLLSYETSIATENDAQLFGAYSWNLSIVGAFYPLLQIIEVSLRNTIDSAAQQHHIDNGGTGHWFDSPKYTQELNEQQQPLTAEQVKKFKAKISSAKKSAKDALEEKGASNTSPSRDQIISQTDFSTWEYILDKHFYDGSDASFLWPRCMVKCFKKLPRYAQKNPAFHQRDIIRRRIEEVRSFRNRISHNEPAWKLADGKNKALIISSLTDKLDRMMELLYWISPKFHAYTQDIGIESRIRQLLSVRELDRYMHSYITEEISDLGKLHTLLIGVNGENKKINIKLNGELGILSPCNKKLIT
ncbi:MAG: hypothetical protein ACRC61_21015 [Aeromonas salmonicida]